MRRRSFLSLGLAPFLASPLLAQAGSTSWQKVFSAAREKHPWLLAFRSVEHAQYASQAIVEGKVPAGLRGTFYRNGPGQNEIGALRYQHWFDGDGLIQAYRFTDTGITHRARLIETHKYQRERAAGRALYPTLGTIPPDPQAVTSPDTINTANISVLAHQDRLFALWEGGSPWEIDPETLKTRGVHTFSSATAGAPFSAHPRIDTDGTLWNFGYASTAGLLVLWHIAPTGQVKNVGTVKCEPMGMPHDFIVTERHLVIPIAPLHYQKTTANLAFLDRHVWSPDAPTRVLLVDKNDFTRHRWLELPAQWVFHYGNGWEDASGVIRYDGARAENPDAMLNDFRQVMRGVAPSLNNRYYTYRIDTRSGNISETPMWEENLGGEFPGIDPRISGKRHRQLLLLTKERNQPSAHHPWLNSVNWVDLERGQRRTYRYPCHQIPEEHVFVPTPGSRPETRGWIIGTALDFTNEQTLLNIFDARHLADGPVCTARLPYTLPLGLHGKFVA